MIYFYCFYDWDVLDCKICNNGAKYKKRLTKIARHLGRHLFHPIWNHDFVHRPNISRRLLHRKIQQLGNTRMGLIFNLSIQILLLKVNIFYKYYSENLSPVIIHYRRGG